ncbi:MAG: right-handed parallel beta-helix repeat-containing protein, partial [Pedobacter sp.]
YREWVRPVVTGVTYQSAKGEHVEIRGSEILKNWRAVVGKAGFWDVSLPEAFFGDYNPYNELIYGDWFFPNNPLHTGEVFINGKALQEYVTWSCKSENGQTIITAYFGDLDPNKEFVEITVRPSCFYPAKTGVNYITVRGFHMSQAATQWAAPTAEQIGLIGTNWSKGWIIEDNVISDSKCVGITLGKDRASGQNVWSADMSKDGADLYNEMILRVINAGWSKDNIGSHIVRRNKIFNCGAAGICGSFGAAYSQILDNEVHDVYTRRNFYGAEMAGIKFHAAVDMVIKGNHVSNSFIGLWLDWMAQGTKVSHNVFEDNDYVDIFMEMNHGPYLVERNRFMSVFSLRDWSEGGTFRKNYFAGLISRAPQDRVTPVFRTRSTEILEVKPIAGGNNLFIANTFADGKGVQPVRPKMHAMDQEDQLIGYGLSIYRDAAMPVMSRRNKFLGKAQPLKK